MEVSGLYIHPIKSIGRISLTESTLDRFGLRWDRRWMLVDEENKFITQRQEARMTLIKPFLEDEGFRIAAPGMEELWLPLEEQGEGDLEVTLFGLPSPATLLPKKYENWFSAYLNRPARLVFMADNQTRLVDQHFAKQQESVAFSDGFPLLLISEDSLAAFNQGIDLELTHERFRPNIVIRGAEPYAEDQWKKIKIGDQMMEVVKPCSRCVIPSIDPKTAKKNRSVIDALVEQRKWQDGKVYFGQNLLHSPSGKLSLGMPVEVIE